MSTSVSIVVDCPLDNLFLSLIIFISHSPILDNINNTRSVVYLVKRQKIDKIENFVGVCKEIKIEQDEKNDLMQYHLELEPEDPSLLSNSLTGRFHVWLNITKTSTEKMVAEGSKLDRFLNEVEVVFPEAKEAETIKDALEYLKDRKIKYVSKVIGKSFEGKESKPVFVPHSVIE